MILVKFFECLDPWYLILESQYTILDGFKYRVLSWACQPTLSRTVHLMGHIFDFWHMDVAFISGVLSFEVIFFNLWQQSWLINCLCFTKLRRVYRCNAWLFWWHRIRFSGTCVQQGQSRQLSCVILVIFSGNLEIRDTSIEKWREG